MRSRLIAFGAVAAVAVMGCSADDNLDLVLTSGDVSLGAEGNGPRLTRPTNAEGVVIDRSSLPTTPTGPVDTNPPVSTTTTATATSVTGGTSDQGTANDSTTDTLVPPPPTPPPTAGPADTSGSSDTADDSSDDSSDTSGDTGNPGSGNPDPSVSTSSLAPSNSIGWLWPSLSDFASAWNNGRGTIAGSPFTTFEAGSVSLGSLSIGGQGFASGSAIPGGVLSGTVENERDVSSLLIIIPSTLDLDKAMQSVWVTLDGTPGGVEIFSGMEQFGRFVKDGIPAEGTQQWIDSSGEDYSVVLTVVSGSLIGSAENAIEVAVIPVADPALAQSMAQPLRVELLSLLDG